VTTHYFLKALATLRAQFEERATRYAKFSYRLIEYAGDSKVAFSFPPGRSPNDFFKQEALGAEYTIKFANPELECPSTVQVYLFPMNEGWVGEFYSSGDVKEPFEAFSTLAHDVCSLLLEIPVGIPAPDDVSSRIAEQFPLAVSVLPSWRTDPYKFAHAVNWIARKRVHPILKLKLYTWLDDMTFPGDPDEFRRMSEVCSSSDHIFSPAIRRLSQPPVRLFSDIPDIFLASVWAIDWIQSRLEAHPDAQSGPTPEPEPDPMPRPRDAAHAGSTLDPNVKGKLPPTEKAFQCYRIKVIQGDESTQASIAKKVYGDASKQSQVSRDLRRVSDWISAGNVLPDLERPKPKIYTTDPSKLDKGPGQAGRGRTR